MKRLLLSILGVLLLCNVAQAAPITQHYISTIYAVHNSGLAGGYGVGDTFTWSITYDNSDTGMTLYDKDYLQKGFELDNAIRNYSDVTITFDSTFSALIGSLSDNGDSYGFGGYYSGYFVDTNEQKDIVRLLNPSYDFTNKESHTEIVNGEYYQLGHLATIAVNWYPDPGDTTYDANDLKAESSIGIMGWTTVMAASPVPEPATMMLFGIGLLGLAGVSRRKK